MTDINTVRDFLEVWKKESRLQTVESREQFRREAEALLASITSSGESDERAALIQIARDIEGMKRECGMDPESPTAIYNSKLMSIGYRLRALHAALATQPAAPAEVVATEDEGAFLIPGAELPPMPATEFKLWKTGATTSAAGYSYQAVRAYAARYGQVVAATFASPAQAPAATSVGHSITIDFKQATDLLEMFGGEPTEIMLMTGPGHSGEGLYAVYNADPSGSVYLGQTDEDATPPAAPAATEAPSEPVARLFVSMERHDMGQSLAPPPPPFRFAQAHSLPAADGLPVGEYDLCLAAPTTAAPATTTKAPKMEGDA